MILHVSRISFVSAAKSMKQSNQFHEEEKNHLLASTLQNAEIFFIACTHTHSLFVTFYRKKNVCCVDRRDYVPLRRFNLRKICNGAQM